MIEFCRSASLHPHHPHQWPRQLYSLTLKPDEKPDDAAAQMASLSVEPPIHPPPGAQPVGGAPKGEGVCAVVVFDYEAAEDNEMNLTEGEMIEQIEEIDEGENITPLSCRGRSMTFERVSF